MSKAASAKGSGPGGAWTKSSAVGKAALGSAQLGRLDHRRLDVEAGHMPRAMRLDEVQRDAARAAADVEHVPALERQPVEHAVDLLGTARRQVALAPQRSQEADRRVVVFGLLFACL